VPSAFTSTARIDDGSGDGDLRGQVDHRVDVGILAEHNVDGALIAHVTPVEGDFPERLQPREVLVRALTRQIVEDDDLLPGVQVTLHHVAADEAGSARHDRRHRTS